MSKSDGNKRKKNRSGNANVVKIIVAAVLVLALAGYAIYVTGAIPRILNGVTVTETMADGSKKTVGKASVLETNYHYSSLFNQYAMYGQVSKDKIDTVKDEETNTTWRDYIINEAAEEIMDQTLVINDAKANGFNEFSQAARCADMQTESLNDSARSMGYPSSSAYLTAAYGSGMSLRLYKSFLAKEILADEYKQYVSQFTLFPTNDEVKAAFDEKPDEYQMADFNFYFFSAETDKDGKPIDVDKTVAEAQKVADKAKDSDSFTQAVIDVLKEKKQDSYAEALEKGEDTTYHEGMTSSYLKSLNEKLTEYLFKQENVGKTSIIKADNGTYAVLLDALYQDDTATVTYRTLTLNVDAPKDATDEQLAKAAADVEAKANGLIGSTRLSNFEFFNLVKANSENPSEIINGGYVGNGVITNFIPEAEEEADADADADAEDTKEPEVDEAKQAVGTWLFDTARKEGDTFVSVASDKKTVTIYFFVDNVPGWAATARATLTSERAEKWDEDLKANTPAYVVNAGWVKNFAY